MRLLYTLLYTLGLCAYLPRATWDLLRGGQYLRGIGQRLGKVPPQLRQLDPGAIWIHAVSVGEVQAAGSLVRHLRQLMPAVPTVLSTTTATGQALAKEAVVDAHFYCPLDLPAAVNHYLQELRPRALLLVETEIWPNLLGACAARKIPVALVNGRLSAASFSRYHRLGRWWHQVLAQLTLVCARTPREAARFRALGLPAERVFITGNIKADAAVLAAPLVATKALVQTFQLNGRTPLLVAGCTMPGEEEQVLGAFAMARAACPDVRLLLAPRHPERFEQVSQTIAAAGWRCRRRSCGGAEDAEVLLLDTIGELPAAYGLAIASFVGGSLVSSGGHNPLEPAAHGQPVFFGPHMENFSSLAHAFRSAGAALQVNDAASLGGAWAEMLTDEKRRRQMGKRARQVALKDAGASRRTASILAEQLLSAQA
ncbi:MAG: 3-deoxy-D-manno-octulosonic acid transferase [Acidobacteriota bacterium]